MSCAFAEDGKQDEPDMAISAAEAWLGLVDSGKYDASWEEASAYFKDFVQKGDWKRRIRAARSPLGSVLTRKVKSAKFHSELPGAPDGKYVVIECQTRFENKKNAVETITPMLEPDGSWRVSG